MSRTQKEADTNPFAAFEWSAAAPPAVDACPVHIAPASSRGRKKKRVEPSSGGDGLEQPSTSPFFAAKLSNAAPMQVCAPEDKSDGIDERGASAASRSAEEPNRRGNPRCVGNILIDYMFIPHAPKNV